MVNSKRGKKRLWVAVGIIMFLVVAFFAGRYLLYVSIRNAIEAELASLKEQEIFVDYDHLEVNPWKGKIEFLRLTVNVRKDNDKAEGLAAIIPYVLIKGIDVIPFLTNKTLSVHTIMAEDAAIIYAEGSTLFQQDSTDRRKITVKNISIDRIAFPGIDLYVTDRERKDTLAHLLTDIHMEDLFLKKQLDSMTWQRGQILISDLALKTHQNQYGFSAKRMSMKIEDRSIAIDSFMVKPVLGKAEYMQFVGKQDDYIDAVVPEIRINNISWYVYPKPVLMVNQITTRFYMNLFRDKRLPFREVKEKKLPAHLLQSLPFEVKVDTILIKKSYIRYEEHPEEGESSGSIYFDDLYATILEVNNNPALRQRTTVTALTRFMGTGTLNAFFTLPYDTTAPYTATGTLENMPLADVNPMLTPAVKAKIERGRMKKLSFDFSYTPAGSKGEVLLNYEDLKILTLRGSGEDEEKVSHIKTLLLNTFIIKKNMNEDMEADERTGKIDFERDPLRSVFNLWWKSILSGLKSAYNLDNLPLSGGNNKPEEDDEPKKKKKGIKGVLSRIF